MTGYCPLALPTCASSLPPASKDTRWGQRVNPSPYGLHFTAFQWKIPGGSQAVWGALVCKGNPTTSIISQGLVNNHHLAAIHSPRRESIHSYSFNQFLMIISVYLFSYLLVIYKIKEQGPSCISPDSCYSAWEM